MTAAALVGMCWSCAGTGQAPAATATLQAAARATAHAKSFTMLLESVEVTYHAPDGVEQVEHGQASASDSSSSGAASTSGPYAETITKVFIGDHYYEGDSPTGQTPTFSVTQRCAGDTNAAEYVLGILDALRRAATSMPLATASPSRSPRAVQCRSRSSGTVTVAAGYVKTINLNPGARTPPAITIASIDAAPPVTAPAAATPATMSCSTNPTGSATGSASTAPLTTKP